MTGDNAVSNTVEHLTTSQTPSVAVNNMDVQIVAYPKNCKLIFSIILSQIYNDVISKYDKKKLVSIPRGFGYEDNTPGSHYTDNSHCVLYRAGIKRSSRFTDYNHIKFDQELETVSLYEVSSVIYI